MCIRDSAYIDANPNNTQLKNWLDNVIKNFDDIYGLKRPGLIAGYNKQKKAITPW